MYVKNSNFAIYLVLAALVGFGISFLFLSSNTQESLLSGDISKASRYNNVKEDPAMSALEERIQNDTAFLLLSRNTFALIENRVDGLEDLTARTLDICSDIPEFKNAIKSVLSLNAKAANTKQSVALAVNGLESLAAGKKAPGYEQATNNIYVGFQKIEQQLAIGKAFVNEAEVYLQNNEGEEGEAVAALVSDWSVYCMQDALLNKSKEDIAYWNSKYDELTDGSSVALVNAFNAKFAANLAGFGQSIDGFGQSIDGFGQSIDGFGQSIDGFGQSIDGFGQSIDGFGQSIDGFGDAVYGIGLSIDGFGQSIDGFGQSIDGFGGAVYGFGQSIDGFGQSIDGFGQSIDGFGQSIDGFGQPIDG